MITLVTNAGTITSLNGSSPLVKQTTGTATVTGTNTNTGTFTVNEGTVVFAPSTSYAGTLDAEPAAGSSALIEIAPNTPATPVNLGDVILGGDATLALSADPTQWTATSLNGGNVPFGDNGPVLVENLDGSAPGTGYDQGTITGTINLSKITLQVNIGAGFAPTPGEVFDFIINQSGNPVSGYFNSLPDGTVRVFNGVRLRINYSLAGYHNSEDVTLTVVAPPPTVLSTTPSQNNGTLPTGTTSLQVNFSETVTGASAANNFELEDVDDDEPVQFSSVNYDAATDTTTLNLTATLPVDDYQLTVLAAISNSDGTELDGNDDGTPGENYVADFAVATTQPLGFTSGTTTTFATGQFGTFTVTAVGTPAPTLSESSTDTLPSGVGFDANTGVLSGTPGSSSGGTYTLNFTAHNGVQSDANQMVTLTVNQAPTFTSANNTVFALGAGGTFTVTTSGFPTPSLGASAPLPSGVTFVDNQNGTGSLVVSSATAAGSYNLTFTAISAAGSASPQAFTLNVVQAPAIISANNTMFTAGTPCSFTVTAGGSPPPTLSENQLDTLPSGVTFNPNTGVLSGTPAMGTQGTYTLNFTAGNGTTPAANESFSLTVMLPIAVTSVTVNGDTAPILSATESTAGAGTTVTVTTDGPHGFLAGEMASITGVNVGGNTSNTNGYNGIWTIAAVTSTTFTFTATQTGLAAATGGEATTDQIPTIAIGSATESTAAAGTTVTATTNGVSGFVVGQSVTIAGVMVGGSTSNAYNGSYTVASVSGMTFTYTASVSGLAAGIGGTASTRQRTAGRLRAVDRGQHRLQVQPGRNPRQRRDYPRRPQQRGRHGQCSPRPQRRLCDHRWRLHLDCDLRHRQRGHGLRELHCRRRL